MITAEKAACDLASEVLIATVILMLVVIYAKEWIPRFYRRYKINKNQRSRAAKIEARRRARVESGLKIWWAE